jgi:hypothetical protein
MKPLKDTKEYFSELEKRSKKSHVYRSYQLVGLEIAKILEDRKHKALYIKLVKEYDPEKLLRLAKSVAERKNVKNKGGYFMKVFVKLRKEMELRKN